VCSFKAFSLFGALFLVVVVVFYVVLMIASSRRRIARSFALKMKSSKEARDEERAVRVAFC
jgi:hypothetical protein